MRIELSPRALLPAVLVWATVIAGCGAGDSGAADDASTGKASTSSTVESAPSGPEPLFADEFDEDGPLDWKVWQPIIEKRHESYQTDREKNVRIEDGHLVIEAHEESYEDAEYTSAMVQTREAFKYGRFEARMKLPDGRGTWPAFWLVSNSKWPDHGEIDVMEHYARDGSKPGEAQSFGQIESNLHSTPPPEVPALTSWGRVTSTPVADVTEWHTYAVEWEEGEIRFFIDDEQTAVHTRPPEGDPQTWPFDEFPEVIAFDMFLGAWAGPVDASALPQRLLVDWVRVWRVDE